MSSPMELRQLGQSKLRLSPLGLGTWQLSSSNEGLGDFWKPLTEETTNEIVASAVNNGINWFDTAEAYGNGGSERHLTQALKAAGVSADKISIADKWWPRERTADHLLESFAERLDCLNGYPIDLYQIHWPESLSEVKDEMKVMAQLVEEGKIKAVGLCNYHNQDLRSAYNELKKHGITLASVQIRYSLANRSIEADGTLHTAQDLGVSIIAWAPLEGGLLTGRFHQGESLKAVSDSRAGMYTLTQDRLIKTRPLIDALEQIAKKYNVSASEVALNWLTNFHDDLVFAIPGASSSMQVEQNSKAMSFILDDGEKRELDKLSWRAIGASPKVKAKLRGILAKFS